MAEKDFYTDAETTILAVGRYVSAFHLAQEKRPKELSPEWLTVMDNFIESLRVLDKHKKGHQLLLEWYARKSSTPRRQIHSFVNDLWSEFAKDQERVKLIANDYFRRCVWEFILGAAFCIASPTALILLLPFLGNPVILAPVFILTCILIPLLAHFMLINPASKHMNAGLTLNKAFSFENSSEPKQKRFPGAFINEANFEEVRQEISEQYNILDGGTAIQL